MAVVFKNNAKTTLASGINSSATSITVSDGSVFPSLTGSDIFFVTFDDGTNNEIVKVTARSGNTLTVVRAQESTTARSFSTGDEAQLRLTAGILGLFSQTGVAITDEIEAYLDANGLTFPDNVKAQFGAGNDLQIFHDGTTSNIKDAGTGILQLTTNGAAVQIYDASNTTTMARFNTGGAVSLNHAGTTRFQTTATGINVNGTTVSDAETAFSTTANTPNASLVVGNTASSVANGNYKGAVGFSRGADTIQVRSAIVGKQTHTSANRQGLAFLVHPDTVAGTLNEAFVINHDSTASFSGNVVVSGTVDGRDIATDGTKLDGIEAGATADQTQSEINALGITATGLSGSPNITVGTINSGNITSTGTGNFGGKVTISDSGFNNHLRIERSGQGDLYLTPSGQQLMLGGGGFTPANTNDVDLGRSDKYWRTLLLGTSLQMGGTTVIDSSRNLTNIGTISSGAITSTGASSFGTISSGTITVTGNVDVNGGFLIDVEQINGVGASGWLDFNMDTDGVYPQSTTDNQTVLGSVTHMNFVGDSNANGTGGIFNFGYGVGNTDSGTFTQTMSLDRSGNLTTAGTISASGNITQTVAGSNYFRSIASSTGNAGLLMRNTVRDWYILNNSAGTLELYDGTANAVRMSINTSGNTTFAGSISGTLASTVTATTQSAGDNSTKVATTAYTDTAIANLVDGAPSTLNTLNEIAAALNDDAALNTTLTNSIATKLPLAGGTLTGNLTLSYAYPRINLTDTNHDSDYSIINNDGAFSIYDVTNNSHRLSINSSGNATFAGTISSGAITSSGDITLAANLKATGNNLKLFAGGNHIINMDLNGNFYPQTHNAVDLGFSDSLAFRNLHLVGAITGGATISSGAITSTGTSTFGTVTSASYKVGASTVIDNSRNLINIGTISSGAITSTGQVKAQSLFIDSGGYTPQDAEGQEFKYYLVSQGTDQNYKKVADVTISTGTYKALALRVVLESQFGNFGNTTAVDKTEYVCLFYRSGASQDDQDTAEISGQDPSHHNLRIVKTATGVYELQVRQNANYRDAILKLEVLSTNGGSISIQDGNVNGSTSGTITTPSTVEGKAKYSFNEIDTPFLNIQSDIQVNGTQIINSARNLSNIGTINSGAITSSASITASGNSNNFGNTTIAALSATSGTFSASITASGNSNSFGNSSFGTISSGVITSTGASSGRYTGLEVVNSTNAGGTETAIGLGVVSASNTACDVKLVANRVGANSGSDFYIEQTDSSGSQQETFRITESGNAVFGGVVGIGGTSTNSNYGIWLQNNKWYATQYSSSHDVVRMNANTTGGLDIYNQTDSAFAVIRTGGVNIGSTQVIDGSRNLSNIGTISSGAISATQVGVTNIVTNKVVKFNGSILDDSNITDTGSLITLGSNTNIDGRVTLTSGTTTTIAGTAYLNINANVGNVNTNGSHGLHIGWNKSNGGREINMIFDGGTAQTDTEMIFTSTDGSTYTDIFQINGGGNVDIKNGGLRIGTTTVIDSSRNLSNIASLSIDGDIFGTGNFDIRSTGNIFNTFGNSSKTFFRTQNGTVRFVIDSAGKIGAGGNIDESPDADLHIRTSSLGGTSGDQQEIARFSTNVSNGSSLRVYTERHSTGTDWTSAQTKIQQRIDSTDQGYILFNGSGNTYGIEIGTHGTAGQINLRHKGTVRLNTVNAGVNVTGALQVGSTTVIDSSRNLTNIGTVSCGAITTSGNFNQTGGTFLTHGDEVSSLTTAWQAAGTSKNRGLYPFRYQNGATGQPESGNNANWGLNIYAHAGSGGNYPYGTQFAMGSSQNLFFRWFSNGSAQDWKEVVTANTSGNVVLDGGITSTNFVGTGSYHEIGNNTGAVSNDGSWNARLNISGTSHARLDLFEDADDARLRLYVHSGQHARIDTVSNDEIHFGTNSSVRFKATSAGLDINSGHSITHNGTTVLDSSRNLTNIGTISSGAITTSGTFTKTFDVGNSITLGNDGTFGTSGTGRYVALGFSGTGNGANRIFAHNTGEDHIYIAAATGKGVVIRANGGGTNHFFFGSSGELQVNGTTVLNQSRNLTNIGTISSGAITTSQGNITIGVSGTPALFLSDTGNGGGGAASGKIIFKHNGGDAMGIGYTSNSTADSDMIISTNAGGTYGGYLGLDASGITDAQSDIILEPKTNVRVATGSIEMGTTVFIDQSRNLTNIGTISSGAITSSGLTVQPAIGAGDALVTVAQTNVNAYVHAGIKINAGNTNPFYIYQSGSSNTLRFNYNSLSDAGGQMVLTDAGNLTVSGDITAFSDERLKDNIQTLDGKKALQMRGVSFIRDGKEGSGVIAQEIEKIAPELVITADDEQGTKSVAYGNLVGYLIEAIKDQQDQIEYMKSEIKVLKEANNGNK